MLSLLPLPPPPLFSLLPSPFLEQSWLSSLCKVLAVLSLAASLQPDQVLPYVLRGTLVEGVNRMWAQCHFLSTSSRGLALPSALASFLWTLVGVAPSQAGRELVFSSIHLHWESFTGT